MIYLIIKQKILMLLTMVLYFTDTNIIMFSKQSSTNSGNDKLFNVTTPPRQQCPYEIPFFLLNEILKWLIQIHAG